MTTSVVRRQYVHPPVASGRRPRLCQRCTRTSFWGQCWPSHPPLPPRASDFPQVLSESVDEIRVRESPLDRVSQNAGEVSKKRQQNLYPAPDGGRLPYLPCFCRRQLEPSCSRRQARTCLLVRLQRQPLCWATPLGERHRFHRSGKLEEVFVRPLGPVVGPLAHFQGDDRV